MMMMSLGRSELSALSFPAASSAFSLPAALFPKTSAAVSFLTFSSALRSLDALLLSSAFPFP